MTPAKQRVIAGHHILTLYGHWAVNDPRGSGSSGFLDPKFAPLGPIHRGRKPDAQQPSRDELRAFHDAHRHLLNFPALWISHAMRIEIAHAINVAVEAHGYTCYACAVCSNYLHTVIRTHKHKALQQWTNLAESVRHRLRHRFPNEISADHPVISARPYTVLLFTPDDVQRRITYVADNPLKEGLPPQPWPFITPYDNWPCHKQAPSPSS